MDSEQKEQPNQEVIADEYMTPARQEDLQQKLEAEKAYVDRWAQPSITLPSTDYQSASSAYQPDSAPTQQYAVPISKRPLFGFKQNTSSEQPTASTNYNAYSATPEPTSGSFETDTSYSDTYDDYSTPNEVAHEYAVLSLVFAVVSPLAGIILATLAIKKSKKVYQNNKLAKTSLLVNILALVVAIGVLIFLLTPTEEAPLINGDSAPETTTVESKTKVKDDAEPDIPDINESTQNPESSPDTIE